MENGIRPIVVAYGMKISNGMEFLFHGRIVTIEGAEEALPIILQQCTGYNTMEEIVSVVCEQTGYNGEEVRGVMEGLLARQILVDTNNYFLLAHIASENPSVFLRELSKEDLARMLQRGQNSLVPFPATSRTAFEQLLEKRESVRQFSSEQISFIELNRLAWVMYGKTSRSEESAENSFAFATVPSGGALYPLRLFVLARQSHSDWTVYIGDPEGLQVRSQVSVQQVVHAFLGDSFLEDAAAVYVLACDF